MKKNVGRTATDAAVRAQAEATRNSCRHVNCHESRAPSPAVPMKEPVREAKPRYPMMAGWRSGEVYYERGAWIQFKGIGRRRWKKDAMK